MKAVRTSVKMKSILIIDDDKELAQGMEEFLLDEGYQVETAYNGSSGMEKVERCCYPVILLDIKIPGTPAFAIVRRAKEMHTRSKIFLISGAPYIEQTLKKEKIKHLIEGVFTKPFKVEALLKSINFEKKP